MQVEQLVRNSVHILRLNGEWDSATAPTVEERLMPLVRGEKPLVIADLIGVPFMTSAGVRVLQLALRTARGQGGDLLLAGVQAPLQNVLRQTGLWNLFRSFPDSDAALLEVSPTTVESDPPAASALEQHVQATLIKGADHATLNFSRTPFVANRSIRQHIRETAESLGAIPAVLNEVLLAVDEAITNIVVHGYRGRETGAIRVDVTRDDDSLRICLTDEAPPFDPTTVDPPDLAAPLEERAIGGMGIHLMRQNMDQIMHRVTEQGGNELTLVKRRAMA